MKATDLRVGEEYAVGRWQNTKTRWRCTNVSSGHYARHTGQELDPETGVVVGASNQGSRDIIVTWKAYLPQYEQRKLLAQEQATRIQQQKDIEGAQREQTEEVALLLASITGFSFQAQRRQTLYDSAPDGFPFAVVLKEDLLLVRERLNEVWQERLHALAREVGVDPESLGI